MTLRVMEPKVPLDGIRARLRSLGLLEQAAGTSFLYRLSEPEQRILLILHATGGAAQVYLYPQALGRAPGSTQWFYAALEAAGFGMGSKAGPSIALPLTDAALMDVFWTHCARLLAGDGSVEGVAL